MVLASEGVDTYMVQWMLGRGGETSLRAINLGIRNDLGINLIPRRPIDSDLTQLVGDSWSPSGQFEPAAELSLALMDLTSLGDMVGRQPQQVRGGQLGSIGSNWFDYAATINLPIIILLLIRDPTANRHS